jgi:hypothetical protein
VEIRRKKEKEENFQYRIMNIECGNKEKEGKGRKFPISNNEYRMWK